MHLGSRAFPDLITLLDLFGNGIMFFDRLLCCPGTVGHPMLSWTHMREVPKGDRISRPMFALKLGDLKAGTLPSQEEKNVISEKKRFCFLD